ncbi:dipeptide epimerase [Thalassotalea sp. 1_MG-2023]|uniref:N-acetyl-D-Glu racemase DgcA n=1 Tax=Thalassotalea sp. 1_MG-2023 TaxID=3062680 RepID=UPI0026E2DB02|nr:N-acetyl-D-Glu racemase DgcA [Thalassotalea sp. 1_MG-2023]MDO6428674.1 dipeptide epimerase [Thalassotalea sp. 1_MG-2023]
MITLSYQQVSFPLAQVFRIARGAKTEANVIEVSLSCGGKIGRAESVPYKRYQEDVGFVINQLNYVKQKLSEGLSLDEVLLAMAPGAAKNAVDCAYWDLKAKLKKSSVEQLLQIAPAPSCVTAQTLSIDTPDNMAKAATMLEHPPLIKVKLDAEGIVEKMRAIHQASPRSHFIVDANEGWTIEQLTDTAGILSTLNVVLIEQPLPVGQDQELLGLNLPVALCADESCHTRKDLSYLQGRYDAINIKLDKTGGLTEALLLKNEALALGFDIMIGCMVGSSLAMAPAFLLTKEAKFVDLDGPLLVARDRKYGFSFSQGEMSSLDYRLWGGVSDQNYAD